MAQITKTNIAAIRADVEAALRGIYAKHGIDVTVGRITYTADNFRCKIEGVVRAAAGTTVTAPVDMKALALKRQSYQLGANFDESKVYQCTSLGRVKVTGFNSKAHKYPYIVQQVATGKKYKVSATSAKAIVAAGAVA